MTNGMIDGTSPNTSIVFPVVCHVGYPKKNRNQSFGTPFPHPKQPFGIPLISIKSQQNPYLLMFLWINLHSSHEFPRCWCLKTSIYSHSYTWNECHFQQKSHGFHHHEIPKNLCSCATVGATCAFLEHSRPIPHSLHLEGSRGFMSGRFTYKNELILGYFTNQSRWFIGNSPTKMGVCLGEIHSGYD